MSVDASPSGHPNRTRRRRSRGEFLVFVAAAALIAAAMPRFSTTREADPAETLPAQRLAAVEHRSTPAIAPSHDGQSWIFDPTPVLGTRTLTLARATPLAADFAPSASARAVAVALAEEDFDLTSAPDEPITKPVRPAARFVQTVPLPMRRPADLLSPGNLRSPPSVVRLAERPIPARQRMAAQEDANADRSFFETVFGARKTTGPALAYAGVDNAGVESAPRRLLPPAPFSGGGGTAIYDISSRTVTLPNGERLEAHSGLGATMDDPRYVHLRGRGSTPPGTYHLTEREAPFHGVRALRMHPVGGAAAIFNRNGLLTHSYLRGPSGASSGCISFRNYDRFLQAYLRGDIRRVVVIAGNGRDALPSFAGLFGGSR